MWTCYFYFYLYKVKVSVTLTTKSTSTNTMLTKATHVYANMVAHANALVAPAQAPAREHRERLNKIS